MQIFHDDFIGVILHVMIGLFNDFVEAHTLHIKGYFVFSHQMSLSEKTLLQQDNEITLKIPTKTFHSQTC